MPLELGMFLGVKRSGRLCNAVSLVSFLIGKDIDFKSLFLTLRARIFDRIISNPDVQSRQCATGLVPAPETFCRAGPKFFDSIDDL
jgi:hypothetical protein